MAKKHPQPSRGARIVDGATPIQQNRNKYYTRMTLDTCANEVQMTFQVMRMILHRTPNVFVVLEEWKQTVITDVTHQCRVQQTYVCLRTGELRWLVA